MYMPFPLPYHSRLSILRNNNPPRAFEDLLSCYPAPGPGAVWQLCFWGLQCKQAKQIFNSPAPAAVTPPCPVRVSVCGCVCHWQCEEGRLPPHTWQTFCFRDALGSAVAYLSQHLSSKLWLVTLYEISCSVPRPRAAPGRL